MPWLRIGHVCAGPVLTRVQSVPPSAFSLESSALCSQFVMLLRAYLPAGSQAQKEAQKPRQVPIDEAAAAAVSAFVCQVPADLLMLCRGRLMFPLGLSLKSKSATSVSRTAFADAFSCSLHSQ